MAMAPDALDVLTEARAGAPKVFRIEPRHRWGRRDLQELWEFRGLLGRLTARDLTLRYRQTALGVIWVVLQPLLAAGVFSLVFGKIARLPSNGVPYFVFSYAGLLAWTCFNSVLTKASTSLVGNAALVSKVFFPRLLLPLSTIGSTLVDFTVASGLMAVLLATNGINPGLRVLLLPVWLLLTLVLATGLGITLSALVVRYRDVSYVLPVAVQFLLYASPVAYALSAVPPSYRPFFVANPLTGLLEGFRWSLLGRGTLPLGSVLYSAVAAVVLLGLGLVVFTRTERRFADVI